jgi:glycerol-3-phosphate dehydrogenase (NAD+)
VEQELLNGQSAQGPLTAAELFEVLKGHKLLEKSVVALIHPITDPFSPNSYPLFVAVHKICSGELAPETFIDQIRNGH